MQCLQPYSDPLAGMGLIPARIHCLFMRKAYRAGELDVRTGFPA
jgi:hypothetical protein